MPTNPAVFDEKLSNSLRTNKFDGNIYDSVYDSSTGTTYLAGDFSYVTTIDADSIAVVNATTGAYVSAPIKITGEIKTIISDGSTGFYIGGSFITTTDVTVTIENLVHVDVNGVIDTTWNPAPDNTVNTLALAGSILYIGGDFTTVGGTTRNYLASVDITTGALLSWNPNPDGSVTTMVYYAAGPYIYVGGYFLNIGTTPTARTYAAGVNTSGGALAFNPAPDGVVNAMIIVSTTIYMTGSFTFFGATARNYAGAWNTANTINAWNPNLDGPGYCLAVSGTTVYIGGAFTTAGGVARGYGAAVTTANVLGSWNPGITDGYVNSMFISGTTVYMSGSFTSLLGTNRQRAAAVSTSNVLQAWNPIIGGYAGESIVAFGSNILIGGSIKSFGGTSKTCIAAINSAGTLLSWGATITGVVYSIALSGSSIYIGGNFPGIGGTTRNNFASIDKNSGALNSLNPAPNSTVRVLTSTVESSTNYLYIGGSFTTISATARNYIAKYNLDTSTLQSFNAALASSYYGYGVTCIVFDGSSSVFLGGDFENIGALTQRALAKVDAVTGANNTSFTRSAWKFYSDGMGGYIMYPATVRSFSYSSTFNRLVIFNNSSSYTGTYPSFGNYDSQASLFVVDGTSGATVADISSSTYAGFPSPRSMLMKEYGGAMYIFATSQYPSSGGGGLYASILYSYGGHPVLYFVFNDYPKPSLYTNYYDVNTPTQFLDTGTGVMQVRSAGFGRRMSPLRVLDLARLEARN